MSTDTREVRFVGTREDFDAINGLLDLVSGLDNSGRVAKNLSSLLGDRKVAETFGIDESLFEEARAHATGVVADPFKTGADDDDLPARINALVVAMSKTDDPDAALQMLTLMVGSEHFKPGETVALLTITRDADTHLFAAREGTGPSVREIRDVWKEVMAERPSLFARAMSAGAGIIEGAK